MIAIDHVLLSDDIVREQFLCDLNACKGGCCVDGDCGAPLTEEEVATLPQIAEAVKPYLPAHHASELELNGLHVWDDEYGEVTPTLSSGICAYGFYDELGIVKCGIEQAWKEGKIHFQKPISCHLFPIKVTSQPGYEALNYEPRETLCAPACRLGRKVKLPVYQFLKGALVRKYGEEFFEALHAVAERMQRTP